MTTPTLPSRHEMWVSGVLVRFQYDWKNGKVLCPGIVPFDASTLAEAKDILRSLFQREQ